MATKSELGQVISWWICTFAALVFLVIRFLVRWNGFGRLFCDDYFLLLGFLCLVGDLAIQQYMWNLGMSDFGSVTRAELIGIMQMIIPGSTLYVTSLWAIKTSLVLFYKRLAARTTHQLVYNITLAFLAFTWIGLVLFIVFQCFPASRKWTTNPAETCSTTVNAANYWVTIMLNIFSDLFIMAIPVSMVLGMKMPKKQKFAVIGVFCLGFCVVISSIVRAYYSHKNETMLTCTVSMIETAIAVITTCLPTLRVLIFGIKTPTGSSSLYPSVGRHYELSSSKQGTTSTNIVSGTSRTKRTLQPGTNNWQFAEDRGGSNGRKRSSDSDESLFRPVDAKRSVIRSNEIDPKTLGVVPEAGKDQIRRYGTKGSSEHNGGIMVTSSFHLQTESKSV